MIFMNIALSTDKEIRKFYNRLYLYKSIFYKGIKFRSNTKDVDLKNIIKALNIKKRKERIAFIYDTACKKIDDLNKGINICGFKNGQCFVQQKKDNGKYDGCCRRCKYNNHGCTTSNLACKLFNCSEVKDRYKVYKYEDIKILKLLNLRQRELVRSDYFSTREEVLKDLYSRSFLYSVTKKAIRQAKWNFLKK